MRRIAFAAVLIALAVIVAASPVRSQSGLGAGPKINISVVAHPIPTHPQYAKLDAPFFKETLAQRSGGRLEFKTSSWTEMSITGYEIVRMTRQGQIDIGGSPLTYIAQDVPFLDAADLAGLNPTVEQARKVLDALIPVVNKELERFNVKVIGSNPYPAQILFCRKPVKDFADLKGRKVRTFGPSLPDLMTAIGATPVSLAYAETYSALERGVVDGTIFPWEAISSFKIAEVLKHHAEVNLYVAPLFTMMNLKKYESLPPDLRKIIDDHSGSWAAEFNGKVWDANELVGIEAIKKAGGTIYKVPAEERQRWAAKLKPVEEEWLKSMEAKGLPGKQLLNDLREAIKKYDP